MNARAACQLKQGSNVLFARSAAQPEMAQQRNSGSVAGDDCIFKSKYADAHIPDNMSLPDFLTANFSCFGERQALTDSRSGESYTFAQLARLFPLASRGFARLGVEFGDTVGASANYRSCNALSGTLTVS